MYDQEPANSGKKLTLAFASPADEGVLEAFGGHSGVTITQSEPLSGAPLRELAGRCDVLVTRAWQRVDDGVLAAGSARLLAVVQASAGQDNIDHAAAVRRGVEVVAVDPGNAVGVAELTLLALMALLRDYRSHWERTRAGQWPDRERLPDREIRHRVLGLVGLGRVGRRVALRAAAFEMTILAVDPYVADDVFAAHRARRLARLDEMLGQIDALSLHCPLTDETRGMVGTREIQALPAGAVVINTARGGIVDEAALRAALDRGHLAGAALDVFELEPVGPGGINSHPKVLATPHLAGHTVDSHRARARNLIAALSERIPAWLARANGAR